MNSNHIEEGEEFQQNPADYKYLDSSSSERIWSTLKTHSTDSTKHSEQITNKADLFTELIYELLNDDDMTTALNDLATALHFTKKDIPVELITSDLIERIFLLFESLSHERELREQIYLLLFQILKHTPLLITEDQNTCVCLLLYDQSIAALETSNDDDIQFSFHQINKLIKYCKANKYFFTNNSVLMPLHNYLQNKRIGISTFECIKFLGLVPSFDEDYESNPYTLGLLRIFYLISENILSSNECIRSITTRCFRQFTKVFPIQLLNLQLICPMIVEGSKSISSNEADNYSKVILRFLYEEDVIKYFTIADFDEMIMKFVFNTPNFRPGNYSAFTSLVNRRIALDADIFGEKGILDILDSIHAPCHFIQMQNKVAMIINLIMHSTNYKFEDYINQTTLEEMITMINSDLHNASELILIIGTVLSENTTLRVSNTDIISQISIAKEHMHEHYEGEINEDCINFILTRSKEEI